MSAPPLASSTAVEARLRRPFCGVLSLKISFSFFEPCLAGRWRRALRASTKRMGSCGRWHSESTARVGVSVAFVRVRHHGTREQYHLASTPGKHRGTWTESPTDAAPSAPFPPKSLLFSDSGQATRVYVHPPSHASCTQSRCPQQNVVGSGSAASPFCSLCSSRCGHKHPAAALRAHKPQRLTRAY